GSGGPRPHPRRPGALDLHLLRARAGVRALHHERVFRDAAGEPRRPPGQDHRQSRASLRRARGEDVIASGSMRRAIVLLLLSGGAAWAEESDYRPENEGWNGLSELFAAARTAGVRPEMRAELPWDELGRDDGVAIIYPRVSVDVGRLRDYLARGGRALVADDFGAAASVFESFGLARGQPPAQTPRYQDLSGREMPELPIAQAENHPLTQGVQRVVANHPAALHGQVGKPILSFGAGESLCVELEVA